VHKTGQKKFEQAGGIEIHPVGPCSALDEDRIGRPGEAAGHPVRSVCGGTAVVTNRAHSMVDPGVRLRMRRERSGMRSSLRTILMGRGRFFLIRFVSQFI